MQITYSVLACKFSYITPPPPAPYYSHKYHQEYSSQAVTQLFLQVIEDTFKFM